MEEEWLINILIIIIGSELFFSNRIFMVDITLHNLKSFGYNLTEQELKFRIKFR